jgi:putative transcriptional regulator
MKNTHDKLLNVLHTTAKGLHAAGVMKPKTMREFDALCLPPYKNGSRGKSTPMARR